MQQRAQPSTFADDAGSAETSARVDDAVATIKSLIARLPKSDQQQVLDKLTKFLRPIPAPRAGDVLGAIVRLLPERRDWTVEDLKRCIDEQKVEASNKSVYNALGYLTRTGRVRRVGYGRYVVDGAELTTIDDLGLPSTRHEDEYRTDRVD